MHRCISFSTGTSLSQQARTSAHSAINLCRMPRKSKMHQVPDYDISRLQIVRWCHARCDLEVAIPGHLYNRIRSMMQVTRNVIEIFPDAEYVSFLLQKRMLSLPTIGQPQMYVTVTSQEFHGYVAPDRLAYSGLHHRETHVNAQRPLLGGCLRP
jgi:hypothetical protein